MDAVLDVVTDNMYDVASVTLLEYKRKETLHLTKTQTVIMADAFVLFFG